MTEALKFGGEKPKRERKKKEVIPETPRLTRIAMLCGILSGLRVEMGHAKRAVDACSNRILQCRHSYADLLERKEITELEDALNEVISAYKPLEILSVIGDRVEKQFTKRERGR